MSGMTVEAIDSQIVSLESQILEIADPIKLQKELVQSDDSVSYSKLNQLQTKDDEIVRELSELQELWVISNLLKEVEVNLELYEFETVLYSFDKLKQKADEMKDSSIISDRIFQLNQQILASLSKVWNQLLNASENSITYNAEIEIDGNLIQFDSIYEIINDNKLSAQLHSNVSHIIDNQLISPIIENRATLSLDDNSIRIVSESNPSLQQHLGSVRSLVLFIQQFSISDTLITYTQKRLFDWLKQLLVSNVEKVYHDQDLQNEFKELGSFLDSEGYKRNDIVSWIDRDLNNIVIEFYLNSHIDKIRVLFESLDTKILSDLVSKELPTEGKEEPKRDETNVDVKDGQDDQDDWSWGDEDLDLDEVDDNSGAKFENKDDDDGWDAWDEEEDNTTARPKKQLISKLSKHKASKTPSPSPVSLHSSKISSHWTITKIPDHILAILNSFVSTKVEIPEEFQAEHHSKLNYLATTYYILAVDFFKGDTVLLYNDFSYVTSSFPIPRLSELTENLLLLTVEQYEGEIEDIIKELNGLDPSLSSSTTYKILETLQSKLTEIVENLQKLSNVETFNKVIISLIDQFYQNIIDCIMAKESIGEDESNYLSVIIDTILGLKFNGLDGLKKVIKNYTKLIHINFILSNHMNEIMNSFYKAEFFDLETHELISLLDKLFADSELKTRNIQEIREIRETEI